MIIRNVNLNEIKQVLKELEDPIKDKDIKQLYHNIMQQGWNTISIISIIIS